MLRMLKSMLTASLHRPTRCKRLQVESLESRDVPATYWVWIGPAGGDWSTASNWNNDEAPPNGVPLYFGSLGGTNTSSIDNIANLTVSELSENNTFTGSITIDPSVKLTVSGDMYEYAPVTVETMATLTVGLLDLQSTLSLMGSTPTSPPILAGSTLDMPLATSILDVYGNANMNVANITMVPGAVWNTEAGAIVNETGGVGAGTVNMGAGSIINITGPTSVAYLNLEGGEFQVLGSANSLEFTEQVNINPGEGAPNTISAPNVITLAGTDAMNFYNNSSGGVASLQVTGNLTNDGTITFNSPDQTLTETGNFVNYETGTINMQVNSTGESDLIKVSGNVSLSGTMYVTGNVVAGSDFILISAGGVGSGDFTNFYSPPAPAGTTEMNGWVNNLGTPGNSYILEYPPVAPPPPPG
jgi:hypothetical protein